MSSIRRAMLVGVAALALFAALASTAMATTVHTGSSTGPLYSGSVAFNNLGDVFFDSSAWGVFVCTSSAMGGTVATNGQGGISSASYTNCTNNFGSVCPFTTSNFNWSFGLSYSAVSGGHDGTISLAIPSGGITYTCPGACTASNTITGDWYNPNNANKPASSTHAEVKFNGVSLTGSCGTVTFSATYAVTGSGGVDLYLAA